MRRELGDRRERLADSSDFFLKGLFKAIGNNDAFSNIITSIEVVPIDDFVREYGAEMTDSFKESGALESWTLDQQSASEALTREGTTAIVISSSMGLSGWVLAKEARIAESKERIL